MSPNPAQPARSGSRSTSRPAPRSGSRRRHAAARARLVTGMASVAGAVGLTGYLAVAHTTASTSTATKAAVSATSPTTSAASGDDDATTSTTTPSSTSTSSSTSTGAVAASPSVNATTSSHGS